MFCRNYAAKRSNERPIVRVNLIGDKMVVRFSSYLFSGWLDVLSRLTVTWCGRKDGICIGLLDERTAFFSWRLLTCWFPFRLL